MKNRFISFVLTVVILISIIPSSIEAKGFTKEIDVIYNDIGLKVENKNVSSKELFIYDGELWVPMKDLGKALGLGIDFNFNKRTFKLNSNGKLNINDSSKANVAFQRGYEIQAKERIIGNLDKEIRAFEGRNISQTSSSENIVKNIRVGFSNINIYLDGKEINLDIDPLIFDDDLYVSLVALSPLLYITPSLNGNVVDIDSNAVLLKKSGYNSIEDLAKFRDSLNDRLGLQLAEMEKRKEVLMDVKIPYEEIKTLDQMEKYLNKHLGKISELPVSITLRSGTDNWYSIDIDFHGRYNYLWLELSRRDVEAHVWDIFVAITTLYDEDAKIQGSIVNPYYRNSLSSKYRNYVTFDTNLRDLVFSFINSNLDLGKKADSVLIVETLTKKFSRYYGESFDFSAKLSGEDLELIINPHNNYYIKRWSSRDIIQFLTEIQYEISRLYPGLRVNGRIEYSGEETIHFLIDDGKLVSPYVINKMVAHFNESYGIFKVNGLIIPMKYGFHQVDKDNYKLIVDMDFDRNDKSWNLVAEESLGSFLQDVIKEIISLWDVNIFTQVYDKNQVLVTEFVISQDTVQAVTADPISGDIEEGKSVSLSTNTEDAEIYYTVDGTNPSTHNRIKYTDSIVINKDMTIKAYAVKKGFKDSPVYEFRYTIKPSDNMANGLDGLKISEGVLKPSFDKYEYNYIVALPYSVSSIGITPSASKGTITIGEADILSGDTKKVSLNFGENKVTIVHKEEGKTNRVYNMVINRKEEASSNVQLKAGYTFQTSIIGIFEGQLEGNITDFSGYRVAVLPTIGSFYKEVQTDRNGNFSISGFPKELEHRILGYKYRITDSNGVVLPENNEKNKL